MFTRAAAALGANWTLHDLRHTAAYRMARDPQLPLTDVQWVLGHAHLSTTAAVSDADARRRDRRGPRPSPPRRALRLCGRRHARRRRWRGGAERVSAGLAGRAVRWADLVSAPVGLARTAAPPRAGAARGRGGGGRPGHDTAVAALPARGSRRRRGRRPSRPARRCWRRLLAAPFTLTEDRAARARRRLGLTRLLGWLAEQPGDTWQQRWLVSGADAMGNAQWWRPLLAWARPRKPARRGVHLEQPTGHARCCSSAPTWSARAWSGC